MEFKADAIDEVANGAEVGLGFGGWHRGRAGNAVEHVGVTGIAGEVAGLSGVEIPWPHGVEAETGPANVDPVGGVGDLVNAGVGRRGLRALAAAPSRHGGARELSGGGLVEAGVGATGVGEPAVVARIRVDGI